ncbi:UNVERIFIED_CONTAM: hypothetical protein Sradi_4000400 [Sesamum radiatum]|uniref:Uncharacterized protein n=1 Tax=Sesamum radiatum TaxID=300843 RepID=A0AAW2PHA5_SESRA
MLKKLDTCQADMIDWNRTSFGNVVHQVKTISQYIDKMQQGIITATTNQKIEQARKNLDELLIMEELIWKQRAKAPWLKEGDRNTTFFHAKASERKHKKVIKRLKDDTGRQIEAELGVRRVILEYFVEIFRSSQPEVDAMNGF